MNAGSKVDDFVKKHVRWTVGLSSIREILLETELEEEIKWGMPTYTLHGKNVLSYAGFKNHFGIWFHQGVFLKDELCILENAQEGKTKGMRHIKYISNAHVNKNIVRSYILEAIQNQKDGKEIKPVRKNKTLKVPDLLKTNLSAKGLTKLTSFSNSKRNEYIEYINGAKREDTKMRRIIKISSMIEEGIGLNDQYKSK